MLETLIKRNGQEEPFIASKANHWVLWAGKGLEGRMDWSSIVIGAVKSSPAKMTTQDFQMVLIKQLLDKMSYPELKMAGALYSVWLKKHLYYVTYGERLPTVKQLHDEMVKDGLLRKLNYSDAEYALIEQMIDHNNDIKLTHPEIQTLYKRYSIQNRITGKIYETPQFVFMRVAMALCETEHHDTRLKRVQDYYQDFVRQTLSAPSPNFTNLGTFITTYASCCLIAAGDNKTSIDVADVIAYQMTCASAGIGGIKMVRSVKDPVMNGMISHGGKMPYYTATAKKVRSSKQNGRGGALTEYVSCYDPEIMEIIRAQNPRTPIDKQNRDCHFAIETNSLFHRKVALNEPIFTFNCYTAPELYYAQFIGDQSVFDKLYARYENDPGFVKNYLSAREIAYEMETQAREVSTLYHLDIGQANHHTPFKDPIYSSNLCVAPDTPILTKEYGYLPIRVLKNQPVTVWNGQEWSQTTVVQTSIYSRLYTVTTTRGTSLEVTAEHKWYIKQLKAGSQDEYEIVQKTTTELQRDDELIEFDLQPVDHGEHVPLFDLPIHHHTTNECTLAYRVQWLNELFKVAGKKIDNGVCLTAISHTILTQTHLMLQELGIHSTLFWAKYSQEENPIQIKEVDALSLSERFMALGIHGNELIKLKELGFQPGQIDLSDIVYDETYKRQKNCIEAVSDYGKFSETYCVTEPKRHMVMFNGILTGNCDEITQPTLAYTSYEDLFKINHRNGEVSICNLGGINVAVGMTDEQYEMTAYNVLDMIDRTLDMAKFPFPHIEYTAKARRNAAVGIVGLAEHMARKNLRYDTPEGLKEIHRVFERHYYFLLKAALKLGIERGNAPWINRTKWPEGWLPIDTYKKTVDELVPHELVYDWEDIRQQVIANGGIRFSVLCALMPTEASARVVGAPNSVYPIRRGYVKKPDMTTAIDWVPRDYDLLKDQYQLAYDIHPVDQMKFYAVMQKWVDQSISADQFDNRIKNPYIEETEIIDVFLTRVRYGVKSRYYLNSLTSDNVTLLGIDTTQLEEPVTGIANAEQLSAEDMCPGGFCSL